MNCGSVHGATIALMAPRPIRRYASSAVIVVCVEPMPEPTPPGTAKTLACTGPCVIASPDGRAGSEGQLTLSGNTIESARSGGGAGFGSTQLGAVEVGVNAGS